MCSDEIEILRRLCQPIVDEQDPEPFSSLVQKLQRSNAENTIPIARRKLAYGGATDLRSVVRGREPAYGLGPLLGQLCLAGTGRWNREPKSR